jgi:transcriptional regulator with XRE-family HTH domain
MTTESAPAQTPLRDVRKARGLGLRRVARQAEVDPAHLSRIERGLATPSLAVLKRLAAVLGLRELEKYLEPYGVEPEGRADE